MKKYVSRFAILISICSLLIACRTTQAIEQAEQTQRTERRTAIATDSIYIHDSVYIREYAVNDTVYIDRYRERATGKHIIRTDTLYRDTIHTITRTEQLPPQRYVPPFYKWTTAIFFTVILLFVGWQALRLWMRM